MQSFRSKHSGLSLLELLLGLTLLGVIIFGLATLLPNATQHFVKASEKQKARLGAEQALLHVQRIGRMAQSCQRTATNEVECEVNFSVDASSNSKKVRFRYEGSEFRLKYEEEIASTWSTRSQYPEIADFIVCDAIELAASTCTIPGGAINTLVSTHADLADRFFRIAVRPRGDNPEAKMALLQTAFFIRHPVSIGDYEFLWGARE